MTPARQIGLIAAVFVVAAGAWFAWSGGWFGAAAPEAATAAQQPNGGAGGGGQGPNRGGGQGRAAAAVPVVTAVAGSDDTGLEVRAVGTVAAARAVTIYPQATGVVTEVTFTPGTAVAEGAPLVHLDSADQEVAVERARIALDAAELALQRSEHLAQSNNISSVALADARTAVRTAEIDLQSAERELARRTLTAPFAGVVGLTDVTIGDLVSSQKAITTLDDMTTVTVAFEVPERASGRVAAGQPIAATTDAHAGETFAGEVSAVDSRVDPVARSLKVEARLPNDANTLKPGMALNVTIDFPGVEHPSVPSLAVQWDRDGPYVWKVTGDTVSRAGVQVVARRSGIVVVAGEIATGDEVVVEGLQRMREGVTVSRVGGDAPPGAGGNRGGGDGQPTARRAAGSG